MVAKYEESITPFGVEIEPPLTPEEEEEKAQEEKTKRDETEAKEPKIVEMAYAGDTVLDWIIDRVWGIFWVFYDLSVTLEGVWLIGDWLATPFRWVANGIYNMLSPLYEFRNWVGNTTAWVARVIDIVKEFFGIKERVELTDYSIKILSQDIETIRARLGMLPQEFEIWWGTKELIVNAAIAAKFDIATEAVEKLRDKQLLLEFTTSILKGDIIKAIDLARDAQIRLDELEEEHRSLWDDIKLFFTNPVEFIWTKFTDWFLGKE